MIDSWVLEYTKLSTGKLTRECVDSKNIDGVAKIIADGNKTRVRIYRATYSYSVKKPTESTGK